MCVGSKETSHTNRNGLESKGKLEEEEEEEEVEEEEVGKKSGRNNRNKVERSHWTFNKIKAHVTYTDMWIKYM